MGVAGSINPTGGAPKPDPARVAAIHYTIVDEAETCATFGESARATLASLNDRTLAETRSGDLGECRLLLDHIRDRVAALDPARLVPRGGLAGLFDSRAKRLKAFRAGYASTASAVSQSAADIGDRAGALARKGATLETLWSDTRDAITDLDAHIAAAKGWLANEAPAAVEAIRPEAAEEAHEGCEAQADAEAQDQTAEAAPAEILADAETIDMPAAADKDEPPTAAVVFLPHPLETRLAALEAVRATAIARLPLLRAAQNADCRAPAALKQICDGVEAWRADWQDALGLAAKRPKKIAPDRLRLSEASNALTERIDSVGRELSLAQGRRAELEARSALAPKATTALAA